VSGAAFTCQACGAGFDANPRVTRALAGSKGDPETPHLCWVCVRLHHSVAFEMAQIRKAFPSADT
jgi:hypothetical protein